MALPRAPILGNMPMSARRKRTMRRELRDLLLRACGAVGGLLGLSWDLHHRVQAKPRCPRQGTATVIGHCFGSVVSSTAIAWLVPVVVGMAAGSIIAILLASVLGL
jgi:hypothetical protein